jgi:exopolysaccharide biosynthesis polyprenyl glycosylphosphotransferase
MLFIRYQDLPSRELVNAHSVPFAILFGVWVIVFFIAGLYEKHTTILKGKLPTVIFNAQIINSVLAVAFFYFIPSFGITPKINLFIYLALSFLLVLYWRLYGYGLFGTRYKENALLIGGGTEMKDLLHEVNNNSRYGLNFISSLDADMLASVDFQEEIVRRVYAEDVKIIVLDLRNEKIEPVLSHLYNLLFSKVRFIDMYRVYEDVFDRIPLSLLRYSWFLENISATTKFTYDFLKRGMDITISFVLFVLSLVLYPIVFLMIKLEDGGTLFFTQVRVGKNNKIVNIIKFRTMPMHTESSGIAKDSNPTRVGAFLRRSRIDELPQLWNVLRGDLSLIGPRPEIPYLVKLYEKDISYYNIRHLIKPGLSGWAQIYHKAPPKFTVGIKETRDKLSYDLFYIKNRSILLDIKIGLKTIKTLFSRSGV